jgi:hypothetical protein
MHQSLKCWIQRTDFSSEEYGDTEPGEAKRIFRDFDWASELARFEPEQEAHTCCACGMGLHSEDSSLILHVCPRDSQDVFFHFDWPKRKRFLWFRWLGQAQAHAAHYPKVQVPRLIDMLYAGEYESIAREAESAEKPDEP